MSEVEAWKATESRRLIINDPQSANQTSFGAVIDRYVREALPERQVTRSRYVSWINTHIKPKWRDVPITQVKPLPVELWVNDLKLAGKSKGHIREMMHLLFNWAMRWELTPVERNPMSLVRVKGSSKRTKVPRILTIKEFNLLAARLTEPFRTMALVALFLGPRVSEIAGMKWIDIDWDNSTISIARSWVAGNVEDTDGRHRSHSSRADGSGRGVHSSAHEATVGTVREVPGCRWQSICTINQVISACFIFF